MSLDAHSANTQHVPMSDPDSIPVATRIIQPVEKPVTEADLRAAAKAKADALLLGSVNDDGMVCAHIVHVWIV